MVKSVTKIVLIRWKRTIQCMCINNCAQMKQSTLFFYALFANICVLHPNHIICACHLPLVHSCPFHAYQLCINLMDSWIWLMTKMVFLSFDYFASQILISARGLIRILSRSTLQTHFLLMNESLTLVFTLSLHPLILSESMFMTRKFSSGTCN